MYTPIYSEGVRTSTTRGRSDLVTTRVVIPGATSPGSRCAYPTSTGGHIH